MPSFRRRASVTDTDRNEEAVSDSQDATAASEATAASDEADALALADAEAAEAEAAAAAARARARALRLRREYARRTNGGAVEAAPADAEAPTESADAPEKPKDTEGTRHVAGVEDVATTEAADEHVAAPEGIEEPRAKSGGARLVLKIVAMTLGLLITAALLVLTGLMVWQDVKADRQDERNAQLNAEYAAAGRQSVVTLMSLNFSSAQDDVKRIIENSTGQFKSEFEGQAQDFIKVAQESKVVTDVTVNATAVESMDADSAVVLVAANSRVSNAAGANQEPRSWRLAVDLQREGDQIKMSKVEFVP